MLTPETFDEKYDDDELAGALPDRPVTSLRDVQYLYGTLYTLATAGGGEYAAYLTPDDARDLVDTDESLIAVRVDLSGDAPRLGADPVLVTSYTEELIEPVAHCRYPAARGIDHSVTHRAGRNSSPEKLARYAKERLTKWATDEAVQDAATEHEQGWVIEALAALGEDETVLTAIEEAVERELGGPRTALLTVQVRTEASGEYRWPGEIEVFGEAMRARKLDKLVSKGEATDSAGVATDLVTGERTRTVGTAGDPLNYFLGKQLEKFPGLDPDEAWRTHSISEDAAVTVMNAETFVDACTYRAFNASVYYLPYFLGHVSPEDARDLYSVLYRTANEAEDMTPVERTYQELGGEEVREYGPRLRFYVAAVMKHQMSRYDVFGDTMNGSILYPDRLSSHHNEILRSWPFTGPPEHDSRGRTATAALPTSDGWSLLSRDQNYLSPIATGAYFYSTFPEGDDDSDASADDLRIRALVAALSGDTVPVRALLSAYVDRIDDETEDDQFPSFTVASQFAQLCALARSDMLQADGDQVPVASDPQYDSTRTMTQETQQARADGGTVADARTRKIEQFLEQTPALAQSTERRGAFLLGALIGAVGSYQEYVEDRSTTLVDQYPVKSVTTARLKKITQEAIGKTLTYTRQDKREGASFPGTKFEWIVDELRESMLGTGVDPDDWAEPDHWELDTDDLRFYYGLGVTYGMNDRLENDDGEQDDHTESEDQS